MKVAIGSNLVEGPWGGGNSFSILLKNFLLAKNIDVVSNLDHEDIDLILLTEPRRFTQISSFTHLDIKRYLTNIKNDTIVINRINECDERKGTQGLNKFLINSSLISDHTVFISSWLKQLFYSQKFPNKPASVIHNGADENLFKKKQFSNNNKIKLVTHHWGNSIYKGSKTYQNLDKLLITDELKDKVEFTYIGNLPKNCVLKNSNVIKPLFGSQLADELRKHDIYITGSINEPAGMHHIEGALSGLPILFKKSGGVTEYCKDYGLAFTEENLSLKILEIIRKIEKYQKKLLNYQFTGTKMCENYFNLFESLHNNKKEVINIRKDYSNIKFLNQYKIFKKYFYF